MNLWNELTAKVSKIKLPGRKLARQLEFARLYFRLISDINSTELVFKLGDNLEAQAKDEDPASYKEFVESKPYFKQMLADRYLAPDYKVIDLAHYPPGTLGHAYYVHMSSNGFTPNFFPPVKVVDEMSYFNLRVNQTHDIWHVLTGYGVDVVGEIGLQGFYLGQSDDDFFAATLISAGILHAAFYNQKIMASLIRAIGEGFELGKAAKNFYPIHWEKMWARPLEDIRAEFNISVPKITQYQPNRSNEVRGTSDELKNYQLTTMH